MASKIWSWVGIIILSMAIVLVIVRFTKAYDNMKPDVDPVIGYDGHFTYVMVKTIGTAMGMYYDGGKWSARETPYGLMGSGFVATEGFIFTAAHVIVPEEVGTQSGKSSVHITKPLKVLTRTIFIYDYKDTPLIAKLHYIDRNLDIAILKYNPTGILKPANYDLEYAQDMVKKDDVVFSWLHKRDDGEMTYELELKYGIILANGPTTPKMDSGLAWFNLYDITFHMNIQPGDSGSPLFAFRDGKPIFIGIIRAMHNDEVISLSYAVTLPNIRRYIVMEAK